MKRPLFEAHFYNSYYYANAIRNILANQFDYIRRLDDFYGNGNHLGLTHPFNKYSAFHYLIEFVIDDIIYDEPSETDLKTRQTLAKNFSSIPSALADLQPATLPINAAFMQYGITHDSFEEWLASEGKTFLDATEDDVSEYYYYLRNEDDHAYHELLERAVDETFFILFQNRQVLLKFNSMIAAQVINTRPDEIEDEYRPYFASPGILKRVKIPTWVTRAVFFRDRGLCSLCHCDLSGTLNIGTAEHYDHIVPLVQGGLNDVSNIQLLCSTCNLKKGDSNASTSNRYEAWYPKDLE